MSTISSHVPPFSPHIKDEAYRLLVEAALDYAIFLLDKDGNILTWNKGAERLKGYSANEIIGKNFSIFYTQENLTNRHPQNELEIAYKEGRYEEEGWRVKKDGSRFWANVIITKLEDNDGKFIGFTKITRDLTERKEAEEALRVTNASLEEKVHLRTEELEKALHAKDQFLSIASHELNTPLTTMKMQNQMRIKRLAKGVVFDNENLVKMFSDDLKQTNRLVQLVEDLLEITRLNIGKLTVKKELHHFNKILEEVTLRFDSQLEQANLKLELILPDEEIKIFCDAFRIEQILTNLITNAIKYGAGKPIKITLERQSNKAILKVIDHGIGIDQNDLQRVFGQFERAISASEISGMGLGLYIVNKLIEVHDGSIRIESQLGKGSTFIVELPVIE